LNANQPTYNRPAGGAGHRQPDCDPPGSTQNQEHERRTNGSAQHRSNDRSDYGAAHIPTKTSVGKLVTSGSKWHAQEIDAASAELVLQTGERFIRPEDRHMDLGLVINLRLHQTEPTSLRRLLASTHAGLPRRVLDRVCHN
jgi:hypothetical protein